MATMPPQIMKKPVIGVIIAAVAIAVLVPLAGPLVYQGQSVDEPLPDGAFEGGVPSAPVDGDEMSDDRPEGEMMMETELSEEEMMMDEMSEDGMMADIGDGMSESDIMLVEDLRAHMDDDAMSEEDKELLQDMIEEIIEKGTTAKDAMMEDEMPEMMTEEMMEENVVKRYIGMFEGLGDGVHEVSGTVITVPTEDGAEFLRLTEDFNSRNGPKLVVYLTDDRYTRGAIDTGSYVSLGNLKGTMGAQNYEIPAGTDLEKYNHVLIWCEPFNVLFGSAELK